MNQEQNNLNQNNFNTQEYNGNPNNQPLNYQNQNNEDLILTNQQPTNSPKKNHFQLIIRMMAIIAIVLIAVGLFLLPKNKENMINKTKSNLKSNISQLNIGNSISFEDRTIAALTDNGNLYHGEGKISEKVTTKDITKVASNIEKFHNATAIYFIDKNHDLFYSGCSYNSGCSSEATKDYSNVKDINVYGNFCGFIINDNNELLIKNPYTAEFCGLNKKYSEFTKIADNVKETIVQNRYSGYINYDNELYISTANGNFNKVLDDVKTVNADTYDYFSMLILTNDSKLYLYGQDDNEIYNLKLVKEDVKEIGNNYFQTNNGDFYIISSYEDMELIKGESIAFSDKKYYGVLDIKDIKEIIYYTDFFVLGLKTYRQEKIIYISNDGSIVLQDKNTKKKLAYNVDNLVEIFNFVLDEEEAVEE